MPAAIVDTGPLLAWLDRSHRHYHWVGERIAELTEPLLVCEPVLTETMYMLSRFPAAQDVIFAFFEKGALAMAFQIEEHRREIHQLLRKYRDRPMSLADACIVRMSEIHDRAVVLTLDSDFTVYRKHGRTAIDLIYPPLN